MYAFFGKNKFNLYVKTFIKIIVNFIEVCETALYKIQGHNKKLRKGNNLEFLKKKGAIKINIPVEKISWEILLEYSNSI